VNDKIRFIQKTIKDLVGNSKYAVIINGQIKRRNGLQVYVKIVEDQLEFYTKSKVGDMWIDIPAPEIHTSILNEIASSELFGWDFTDWTNEWSKSKSAFSVKIRTNPALRILYAESDMYNLFRVNIPNKSSLNVKFEPKANGQELKPGDLASLLNKFRMNGFTGILDIMENRFNRSINFKSRDIYKIGGVFFPAMVRTHDLFNPFYDDVQIYESIKDRKLFQFISKDMAEVRDLGMLVSHLTSTQIKEGLGLSEKVPFNFQILIRILVGLIMPAEALDSDIPHKTNKMYRLESIQEDMDPYVTESAYRGMSEYEQGFYVESTTYNVFLRRNVNFFRRHGYTNVGNLLEVMRHAALV
jgi:hypothetical protein